jgi:hypothetical protein
MAGMPMVQSLSKLLRHAWAQKKFQSLSIRVYRPIYQHHFPPGQDFHQINIQYLITHDIISHKHTSLMIL